MMESAYIKSEGDVDLQLTLSRLHQKNGLDRYSNEQLNCQGESWKNVVQKLLKQCSTVLIDVRDFTSANKGISYELGIVLDMFPVEQLLIIIVQHLLSQVRTIDDSKVDRKRSKRKQFRKY